MSCKLLKTEFQVMKLNDMSHGKCVFFKFYSYVRKQKVIYRLECYKQKRIIYRYEWNVDIKKRVCLLAVSRGIYKNYNSLDIFTVNLQRINYKK